MVSKAQVQGGGAGRVLQLAISDGVVRLDEGSVDDMTQGTCQVKGFLQVL